MPGHVLFSVSSHTISCVFIKASEIFIHEHCQLADGLKRIVLSEYFFLLYLFVILNLAFDLKLRSGGNL